MLYVTRWLSGQGTGWLSGERTCSTLLQKTSEALIETRWVLYGRNCIKSSSDTQGWFSLLHRPLGQLARKAFNLLPKIDTKRYSVQSNQITALISKLITLVILLIRKWGWNQWNDSIRSVVNRRKFNLLSQGWM